jgi:hypothetical protein
MAARRVGFEGWELPALCVEVRTGRPRSQENDCYSHRALHPLV